MVCATEDVDCARVDTLLKHGALLTIFDSANKTPIDVAFEKGFLGAQRIELFYNCLCAHEVDVSTCLVDGIPLFSKMLKNYGSELCSRLVPKTNISAVLNTTLEKDPEDSLEIRSLFFALGVETSPVALASGGYGHLLSYLMSDRDIEFPCVFDYPAEELFNASTPIRKAVSIGVTGEHLLSMLETHIPSYAPSYAPFLKCRESDTCEKTYINKNSYFRKNLIGMSCLRSDGMSTRFRNFKFQNTIKFSNVASYFFEVIIGTDAKVDIGFVDDGKKIPDMTLQTAHKHYGEGSSVASPSEDYNGIYLDKYGQDSFKDFIAHATYHHGIYFHSNEGYYRSRTAEGTYTRGWAHTFEKMGSAVVGVLVSRNEFTIFVNGEIMHGYPQKYSANTENSGFSPAFCLSPGQILFVNCGQKPFLHPPGNLHAGTTKLWTSAFDELIKMNVAKTLGSTMISSNSGWVQSPQLNVLYGYYDWAWIVAQESAQVLSVVASILKKFSSCVLELAQVTDEFGRKAIDLAVPQIKELIQNELFFLGRYEFRKGPPEHQSATCTVIIATDWKADGGGDEGERVALKFMRIRDQFQRELQSREGIDSRYLMPVLRSYRCPDDDKVITGDDALFAKALLTKESLTGYRYLLVLPYSDRPLSAIIQHEHICGSDWEQIRFIIKDIIIGIDAVHKAQRIHGDLKPLNVMRRADGHLQLIDMDASVKLGDPCGVKLSTAYVPPEFTFLTTEEDSDKEIVSLRNELNAPLASTAWDYWSIGVVLYNLCTGETLWQTNTEDNLVDEVSLEELHDWTFIKKSSKLAKISDPQARNLVAQLLSKDPTKRPHISQILDHPFLSKKTVARMIDQSAEFDVFLSYRVASDAHHVEILYQELVGMGLKVWWDKMLLKDGENWEEGFCKGLIRSKVFVCLLSKEAIHSPSKPWQNFEELNEDSRCDNVFLEHRFALELHGLGLLDTIFPVVIGDPVEKNGDAAEYQIDWRTIWPEKNLDVSVRAVEDNLVAHMAHQALGTPLVPSRTIRSVLTEIKKIQGALIQNQTKHAFKAAADRIFNLCQQNDMSSNSEYARIGLKSKQRSLRTIENVTVEEAAIDIQKQLNQSYEENRRLREEIACLRLQRSPA